MKKENTGQQKQIYSIRKNKAYGASSVLIGLMGSAFLLSGLAPTVQAEENDAKPETKPADGTAMNGTNAPTVETEHLIIASQPKESEPKPESIPTDNPKTDLESDSTNVTNPLNGESPQPKEEPAAPVNPTEGAKPAEAGTTEAKTGEETTPSKRAVSIVYKVRYVDRKSGKVVHEVTKTKTVETTEAKAKATVTEIGGELAMDSQLENYYVPDGNPTTMTKEIVEGADNVFVYDVEGFGEAETPKERTVALKYMVEYVDGKSGLVLASEEKEEKVSTTETVAKKEVTVQPSLAANEKLKDWVLSDGAPTSQKLTLTEGTVGKVTFNLQNSEGGKVRNKRKVSTAIQNGRPYLTLENMTSDFINEESMTFAGNGNKTYNIIYKIGASNLPNNDLKDLEMTKGAKDLGFTLDREHGFLTATLTPTRDLKGDYEVGFYTKSDPKIKVAGTIKITATEHYGFMLLGDWDDDYKSKGFYYFSHNEADEADEASSMRSHYDKGNSPIYGSGLNSIGHSIYVYDKKPLTDVTIDDLYLPTTPFGYMMPRGGLSVEDADAATTRYYTMLPIFAPMDRSLDFVNNDKKWLSITDFKVLGSSDGVNVKLVDLTKDKAPDKGVYSNSLDFQTVPIYNSTTGDIELNKLNSSLLNTPYYLQFTKLPKTAGKYFVKFEMTDRLGLTKRITLNFRTYENSVSGTRNLYARDDVKGESYALTVADTLFDSNEEYVNKKTHNIEVPMSDKEQILGKVVLNKENAYIKSDEFPAGVELRAIDGKVDEKGNPTEAYVVKKAGVKVQPGTYTFSVKAFDGHFQEGGARSFGFEIVDAINPIADQHWREGEVPTPIPVSLENHSKITGIRVEASGGYAVFEGNSVDSNISIYGLKHTEAPQKARVYVTYTDGDGKKHETYTDFNYVIDPNPVEGLGVEVTNGNQEIFEGDAWQPMEITTTPREGVTIKVDKTKLPKGTRLVGNVIKGKGLYEGIYDIPILAIKGDIVKATAVHLVVKPKEFVVPEETAEVEVLSNNIKAVTVNDNGETVKTPVSKFGFQNAPEDAKVRYYASDFGNSGLKVSDDGSEIIGTPSRTGSYRVFTAISREGADGQERTAYSYYTINVTGLTPSLTISSATQPTDAHTSRETRVIAPIGAAISPITIQHDPHSTLSVSSQSLPRGLSYSYDAEHHTATIEGTPSEMYYEGYVYKIPVSVDMPYNYANRNGITRIDKTIHIEVQPVTSNLTIDNADQTFAADKQMTKITISDFDNRATIRVEGAPDGVSYNTETHQITGAPTAGVGNYRFSVTATMPRELDARVTRKWIDLTVTKLEPTLTANPSSVDITAKENIPTITISKDSFSTLSKPTVRIDGSRENQPLSSLGLSYSYDAENHTAMITGTPTVVGHHTIHLSTTLSQRYTGEYTGVTKELDIPVTVNAKSFDLNINNQTQTKTVLSPIDPVVLTVPEGINLTVDTGALPPGVTYNAESKSIEGIPSRVGTYNITVTARPNGITGNDKTATVTIQVNPLEATIGITPREQTVQVGTQMAPVTVTPNTHASVYGTDALLNAVSGTDAGIAESNVVNYFLGAYGLTYNSERHTITGTPTKTGRIVFTFIARNSKELGSAEARETFVLNVVESLSKIPVITEAQEGSNAIKGSGVAGATVTVTLPNGAVKTAEVATDGTWTVETTTPLVKGQSISARQKEVNKTESNDISATVVGNSGLVPSKEALVDAIVDEATTVTGKGENGSTITVTRPDGTVKTTTVSEGTWSVTLDTAAVKGENILVTQTEPNKATSPAVTATVVPKITKGDRGEQGNPGTNGKDGFSPEISVTPNDDGSYTITITQPDGKKPIKTTVKNGTNGINGRDGRTPKVKLTPIYEDPAHPRTRRTRSVDEDREAQPTGKQIGVHITVYYDNNNSGTYDEGDDLISEENIYDGVDGIDGHDGSNGNDGTAGAAGRDGKDGFTPKVTVTDNPDGSHTITITQPDNQPPLTTTVRNGVNGKDGKSLIAKKEGNETKIYVEDPANPGQPLDPTKPVATILDGLKGEKGDNGADGKSPTVSVTDNGDGTHTITIHNPDNSESTTIVKNGKDGKTATITTVENPDGSHTITVTNPDGTSKETVVKNGRDGRDGVDGRTPTASVRDNGDGSHTIIITNPNGNTSETTVRDGQTPKVKTERNEDKKETKITFYIDKNGDGDYTEGTDTLIQTTIVKDGENGANGAAGRDGKDGFTPKVTVTDNPDGSHTITITQPDNQPPLTTTVRNGVNGKDGKSLIAKKEGNETKIYVEDPANPGQPLDPTKPVATILDGLKGEKGDNGADGKSPTVSVTDNGDGTHTITIHNPDNSESSTIVRNGENGKTATITTTENPDGSHTITVTNPDGTSKETVIKNGKDGKTPKVEVTDNNDGTHTVKVTDGDGNVTNAIIKDGKDGKAATATTTENQDGSHTVTITNPDGTKNEFVVKNGRDGVDGRTPTATVRNNGDGSHTIVITNPNGDTTETTVRDGKTPTVSVTDEHNGTHKITIVNGDGTTTETIIKDGKSPVATVRDNKDGTYTVRVENGNGTVSEITMHDGKSPTAKVVDNGDGTHTVTIVNSDGTTTTTTVRDGKSPKLEVIDNHNGSHTVKVTGTDGKETSTTIFDGKSPKANIVDNGDGTHTLTIVDSNGREYKSIIKDGKDGKDGKSPTVTVKNNNDGTHTVTIINPDGSKTETVIKDGKDGKSPTATVKNNGDGTHTITIINSDGTVTTTVIKDGKCGCNNKPGGSMTPNPGAPTPGGSTTPNPNSGGVPQMPEPPVHELPEFNGGIPGMPEVLEKPEYTGEIPNTPENSTNPNPGGSPTPGGTPDRNPGAPTPGGTPDRNPGETTPGGTPDRNPGEPTPGGTPDRNPGETTPGGTPDRNPGAPIPGGSPTPNPGTPTPGTTPNQPENPSEISITVNEHPNGELPKTGTTTDHLSILLGSGILLSLYVGKRKEEES